MKNDSVISEGAAARRLNFLLFYNAFSPDNSSLEVTGPVLNPLNRRQRTGGLMLSSQTLFKPTEFKNLVESLKSLKMSDMSD